MVQCLMLKFIVDTQSQSKDMYSQYSVCELYTNVLFQGTHINSLFCFLFFLSSPFYGEDFYCEIPRSFRHLSFYIFDRDVFRRDSIIGMCFIKWLFLFRAFHL